MPSGGDVPRSPWPAQVVVKDLGRFYRLRSRLSWDYYGDDRVREQLAVCGVWPHAKMPAGWGQLLSGERDPVTPPADVALVAKGFPHGLPALIPHGAHANEGSCEDLIADFIERGTAQGLDVSCIKAVRPAPFVTAPPPPKRANRQR